MDPELRDIFDKHGSEAVHIFLEVIDGQDTDAFRASARVCFHHLCISLVDRIKIKLNWRYFSASFFLQCKIVQSRLENLKV